MIRNKKIFCFLGIISLLLSFCSKEHKTNDHKPFIKMMRFALMTLAYKSVEGHGEKKNFSPQIQETLPATVPVFIGYTEKAVPGYGKPTKITSLKEYETLFGKAPLSKEASNAKIKATIRVNGTINITMPKLKKLMYYSMQLFFNNGGKICYIIALGNGVNHETAIDTLKREREFGREPKPEPNLIVLPDAIYEDYSKLYQKVLSLCAITKDCFAIFDVPMGVGKTITEDIKGFRSAVGSKNLKYAAAYYPYVQTNIHCQYDDSDVIVSEIDSNTGREKVDANGNVIITALKKIKSREPEKYNKIKKAIDSMSLTLPPSAAVAGVFAKVEEGSRVWMPSFFQSLNSVIKPSVQISRKDRINLYVKPTNGKAINIILQSSTSGRNTLWPAYTLDYNNRESRIIFVQRFRMYLEQLIQRETLYAAFEPNNAKTWLRLRKISEAILYEFWAEGAIRAYPAKDAYFVQCGLGTTMTQKDIDEGRIIIKIGFVAAGCPKFLTFEIIINMSKEFEKSKYNNEGK